MVARPASRSVRTLKRPIVASPEKLSFHPDALVTRHGRSSHLSETLRRAESLWDIYHALRKEKLRDEFAMRLRLHQDVDELIAIIDGFAQRIDQGQDISLEELSDIPPTESLRHHVVRLLVAYRNQREAERLAALQPKPQSFVKRIFEWFAAPRKKSIEQNIQQLIGNHKQDIRAALLALHRHLDYSIQQLLAQIGLEEPERDEFFHHSAHHLLREIPNIPEGIERAHHASSPIQLHAHGLRRIELAPSMDLTFFVEALRTVAHEKHIAGTELETLSIGTALARYDREIIDRYASLKTSYPRISHVA